VPHTLGEELSGPRRTARLPPELAPRVVELVRRCLWTSRQAGQAGQRVSTGLPHVGEPMRYRVEEEVILPEEYAGRPDAVRAITQRFTAALERLVRRYPEQYFWLHRRWKHQPKERKGQRAA
jgi:hypothetical protein